MSCGLVRLRCERRYSALSTAGCRPAGESTDPRANCVGRGGGEPAGVVSFWPQPDHRLFDVPPHLAAPIAAWFRLRGWEVLEEPN